MIKNESLGLKFNQKPFKLRNFTFANHKNINNPLKKRLFIIFIFLNNYVSVFGQNIVSIAGKIINHDTQQPVSGVYIGIPAKGSNTSAIGVISNDSGEFTLKYPILLQATGSFIITKINYKDVRKSLLEYKEKKDSLIFEVRPVEFKTVEARDARKTMDYVLARLEKNYNPNPYSMTGFYRESLYLDSVFVKVVEGVLRVEKYPFPDKGNLGEVSKLLKGRRYEKSEGKEAWEGLQFGNGVDLVTRTLETKLPDFLEKSNLKNYKYTIDSELNECDGMPVFNITFSPLDKKLKAGKIGKIQVDTLTMGILSYEFEFTSDGLKDVMGGGVFGGNKNSKVKNFKVFQTYHTALNNYYLHESILEIQAIIKEENLESPAILTLNFSATEANTRMGVPIKDNEILENTDFPLGGKKYEDGFWGNFNFIKPSIRLIHLFPKN